MRPRSTSSIILAPDEREHLLDLFRPGLLPGRNAGGAEMISTPASVGYDGFPEAHVQPVQILEGVLHRVSGLGLHQETDHSYIQVEIGEQNVLALPPQFGRHVASDGGGATTPFGRKETDYLAFLAKAFLRLVASTICVRAPAAGLSSAAGAGIRAPRPQRAQDQLRLRSIVERDYHGIPGAGLDPADYVLHRLAQLHDLEDHDLRPKPLDSFPEIPAGRPARAVLREDVPAAPAMWRGLHPTVPSFSMTSPIVSGYTSRPQREQHLLARSSSSSGRRRRRWGWRRGGWRGLRHRLWRLSRLR